MISRQIDIDTELVTPTGAAIIAEIASSYGMMPAMDVQKVGWGTGTKDLVIPNVLKSLFRRNQKNEIIVMETNIDDCSGEMLGFVMEQLLDQGALDVFLYIYFYEKK